MASDLRQFGGKIIVPVGDTADFATIMSRPVTQQIWDFGNIVPELRDPEQLQAHALAESQMLPAAAGRVTGAWQDPGGIIAAWDVLKALNGDKHMRTLWQQTGSCTMYGLAYVVLSMIGEEIYTQNEVGQKFAFPFTGYNYGLSRIRGGWRGQGEGSMGSLIAASTAKDGYLDNDLEGLPPLKFPDANNASWGKSAEMLWSDGTPNVGPAYKYLETGKKHLIGSVTRVTDGDKGWELLRNRYWQTVASDWGGLEKVPVIGNPGVLLNRRVTTWRHQQSFLATWAGHPDFGDLVYMMNQWRHDFHGICPSGAWPGGFWIRKKPDYDYLCRNGEVYAFSNVGAYPAKPRHTAI